MEAHINLYILVALHQLSLDSSLSGYIDAYSHATSMAVVVDVDDPSNVNVDVVGTR